MMKNISILKLKRAFPFVLILVGLVLSANWAVASKATVAVQALEDQTWHFWKIQASHTGATLDTFDIEKDLWIDLTLNSASGLATICAQRDSASIAIETFEYVITSNSLELIHPIEGAWGTFTWDVSFDSTLNRDVAILTRLNPSANETYFSAVIGAVKEVDANGSVLQSFDEAASVSSEILEIHAYNK